MHLTPKNRITIDPGWTLRNPTAVSAHPNKDVLLDELEGNQLSAQPEIPAITLFWSTVSKALRSSNMSTEHQFPASDAIKRSL